MGAASLGYYNIAYNLIIYPINLINPIFTRVSFPFFSKLQENITILKEKYFELIRIISFVNFPIYFLIFANANSLIPLLYGPQWGPSILTLQILSFSGLAISIGNPIGTIIQAKGFAKLGFYWNLVVTIVYTFFIIIGILLGSIYAVAIFVLISNLIFFIFFYRYLIRRVLGPSLIDYLKSFLKYLLFSSIATILSLLSGFIIKIDIIFFQILMSLIIYLVVYIVCIVIFDKNFLIDFLNRFIIKKNISFNGEKKSQD